MRQGRIFKKYKFLLKKKETNVALVWKKLFMYFKILRIEKKLVGVE